MSQRSGRQSENRVNANFRVVIAQLDFLVGDIPGNARDIIAAVRSAERLHNADLVVFPELCLTGYPPEDLLLRPSLDVRVAEALDELLAADLNAAMVIGMPLRERGLLYNAAVVIEGGKMTARYCKQFPPNYQVFDEKRYFASGDRPCVVDIRGVPVGLTVCEDIWCDGPAPQAPGWL